MRLLHSGARGILSVTLVALWAAGFPVLAESPWTLQSSRTTARLRGLSVVSPKVAWLSGAEGTCLRTTNAGDTWDRLTMPGGDKADFRDVHAFDANTACVLAIGVGEQSKIHRTTDGGVTWETAFTNHHADGFLDAFAFWDNQHGIALGDPVDGKFVILVTNDGGKSWAPVPTDKMPPAHAGEGSFAASGTCLVVQGEQNVWFGTGGGTEARIFKSSDRGQTWTVHLTPLPSNAPSRGVFSVAFRDADHGIAVGGDYKEPDKVGHYLVKTTDGGKTWSVPFAIPPFAFRSAVVFVPEAKTPTFLSVGPSGVELSVDDGETWYAMNLLGFHAADFRRSSDVGWAVGEKGIVARIDVKKLAVP